MLRGFSKLGLSGLPTQVYTLLVTNVIFSVGRNLAYPYLAMFMSAATTEGGLGFSTDLVGTMIMIGGLASTFAYIATGNLCDRFGRRRLMVVSITLQALTTVGFAFIRTYNEFLLLYTAASILGSLFDPAQSAMIADLVSAERREEVYGLSYMIANIGALTGPPIGGLIAATIGFQPLFIYTAAATSIVATIVILRIRESYSPAKSTFSLRQFAYIFRSRTFMLFCLSGALTSFVYSQLYGSLSVYMQKYMGLEPYLFGILFSVNGAMVVVLQIPIRKAAVRIGPTKAFLVAQTLYAAGFGYFMFASDFVGFLIGAFILTLGEITYMPASSGFVANQAPADKRGRYMALSSLFFGIGAAIGAQATFAMLGTLTDKRLTWGILGLVGFATLIGYALLHKMTTKQSSSTGNVVS